MEPVYKILKIGEFLKLRDSLRAKGVKFHDIFANWILELNLKRWKGLLTKVRYLYQNPCSIMWLKRSSLITNMIVRLE